MPFPPPPFFPNRYVDTDSPTSLANFLHDICLRFDLTRPGPFGMRHVSRDHRMEVFWLHREGAWSTQKD